MELVLVRHGETDENKKGTYFGWMDEGLNNTGIIQAKRIAKKLGNMKPHTIYSSPLKRAVETSHIINGDMNSNIEEIDKLKERNFGIWEGLTIGEISEKYPKQYLLWNKDWINYRISRGESAKQVYSRNAEFIGSLLNSSSSVVNEAYIIVTHAGCIRNMIACLLGFGIEDSWRFKVDEGSISRIMINNEGFAYLDSMNCK